MSLDEAFASHETKFSLTKKLSLIGYSDFQYFTQTIIDSNISENSNNLQQAKGSTGLEYKPFAGFELRADLSRKYLKSNQNANKSGHEEKYTLLYNPIKYENFELQLKLTKELNYGFGFNTIQKDQLLQTNNEVIELDIVSRSDEVYLGSLNLNIVFPSTTKGSIIDKVILSGEGYLKYVNDRLNPQNTLMINGFLFSIKLTYNMI